MQFIPFKRCCLLIFAALNTADGPLCKMSCKDGDRNGYKDKIAYDRQTRHSAWRNTLGLITEFFVSDRPMAL